MDIAGIIKHKHHIIPKHMGGSDDPSNLIELTVEEHAEAHKKLFDQYGLLEDKLAWMGLSGMISQQEIIKELLSKPKTEEHKRKIRESHANKERPWLLGNKNAEGNLNKPKSDKHKMNIRKSKLGKSRPDLIGNKNASGTHSLKTCPHCDLVGGGPNMSRYHFNNCKKKLND